MAQIANQGELDTDVVKASDRGIKVMTGTISERSKRHFSSSLRDCAHMAVFASFPDAIDFLQVDGPKLNEIKTTSGHFLNEMGLAARCFVARTLAEVPDAIEGRLEGCRERH
jgi:hypothetical protein